MKLIARWTKNQDSATEHPHSVTWEDGTPATLHDYAKHLTDTHTAYHESGAVEEHFFPDVVAEVMWQVTDWCVRAPGVETLALELHNANASDDAILEALYAFPVVYRAKIIRPEAPSTSHAPYLN